MMVTAVSVQFVAQAEEDFGADWAERMRAMSPSQREAWIARNFPDRV